MPDDSRNYNGYIYVIGAGFWINHDDSKICSLYIGLRGHLIGQLNVELLVGQWTSLNMNPLTDMLLKCLFSVDVINPGLYKMWQSIFPFTD